MSYETPEYNVLEKEGNYELRLYKSYIVAEIKLKGTFDSVGNSAFFILADYINGNNNEGETISMTAPVNQKQIDENNWTVNFFIPSKYRIDEVPVPNDKRIKLIEVEEKLMASIRYSGTWSEKNYNRNRSKLETIIIKKNLKLKDEPVFARYNSPFMPWFMRRNEILIPVAKN